MTVLCCAQLVSGQEDIHRGAVDQPFAQLGAYRLGRQIGRGATSTVYSAVGPDGRKVAIKVALTAGAEDNRQLIGEAAIRIEHKNLVRVLEAGVHHTGHHYIVQELLDGHTLARSMKSGPLAPERVIDLGRQVCDGLTAAHAHNVIHRDLKPDNLFCCRDGTIKILDFGAALSDASESRFIHSGDVIGTPAYMSPEQVHGDIELDARTDIWSLGVILYHALTGQSPFERGDMLATLLAVVMDQPIPLTVARPCIPHALPPVLERAMNKQREERWATADEFARAMLDAAATSSRPSSDTSSAGPVEPVDTIDRAIASAGEKRVVAVVLAQGLRDGQQMESAVNAHGGQFIRLFNRQAIGLFGAQVWVGDEVNRALATALSIRPAASALAVTSGYATLGQRKFTGDLLQTADAGCQLAAPGIAIDRATSEGLGDSYLCRTLNDAFVEVVGEAQRTSAQLVAATDRRSRTVGRQAETTQMQIALETAVEDRVAVAVLVYGSVGVGKTQLCQDLRAEATRYTPPIAVLSGQARALSSGSDYAILLSALRERLATGAAHRGWPDYFASASVAERRRALGYLAREAIPDEPDRAEQCATFLGMLLGIDTDHSPHVEVARSQPRLLADRIRLAWHDYFDGLLQRGPVAVFLEDLQWADRASLRFLHDAMDRMSERPLFVFATVRADQPERVRELFAGHDVERIHLRGLPRAEARELAQSLAERPLNEPLVEQIVARTSGNPLFIEQIVGGLPDDHVQGADGADGADLWGIPIPHTVDAAVQSRLDHLLPAEKDLCKRAAILERPFAPRELRALGLGNPDPLIESLSRRGILHVRQIAHSSEHFEIHFKSLLMSEVAYRMNTEPMRVALHRRIARYLAEREPIDDHEEIAHHHDQSGERALAGSFYAAAALANMNRSDTASALRCAEKALAADVSAESHFALHMVRADAVRFLERRDYQIAALESALAAATTSAQRARALTEKAWLLQRIGDSPQALAIIPEAVADARASGVEELLIGALGCQAVTWARLGQDAQARAALRAARAVSDAPTPHQRARLAEWRAQLVGRRGDLGERRSAFREAVERYDEVGDIRRMVGAEINLADVYNRLGAFAEAERALRAALDGNKKMANPLMSGYALVNLGYSLFMQDRLHEALDALERGRQLAESMSEVQLELCARIYRYYALVTIRPATDENTDRAHIAQEATQVARAAERTQLPSLLCLALAVAARAHLDASAAARSLELSTRAMAVRAQLGGIEEDEGLVFLAHVRALTACGHLDQARSVRDQARRRIRDIAESIDDASLRALFVRAIPAHRELLDAP